MKRAFEGLYACRACGRQQSVTLRHDQWRACSERLEMHIPAPPMCCGQTMQVRSEAVFSPGTLGSLGLANWPPPDGAVVSEWHTFRTT